MPIRMPSDDDEFPIRTPGAGIATPMGNEDAEKQLGYGLGEQYYDGVEQRATVPPAPIEYVEQKRSSGDSLRSRPRQTSQHRESVTIGSSGVSAGKHRRKKSSLKSVMGRLFGKHRKGDVSRGNSVQGVVESLQEDDHISVGISDYIRETRI